MSNNNIFDDDYDFDDKYDVFDTNPSTVRASGGGTNRPFHSGRGTRNKLAAASISNVNTIKTSINTPVKKDKTGKNQKKN